MSQEKDGNSRRRYFKIKGYKKCEKKSKHDRAVS